MFGIGSGDAVKEAERLVSQILGPRAGSLRVSQELGDDLFRLCYQCGLCSGVCPTSYAMPYTPRQVAHMLQMGLEEEVLESKTHWLCTSCYSCTTQCPRAVPVTDIMASLKRVELARGKNGGKSQRFYRAFMDTIRRRGRLHEVEFVRRYIGADVAELRRQAGLGLALWSRGKVPLKAADVEDKKAIEAMFRKAEEMERTS
jgi:heterodisulfide reductase subunit C